MVSADKFFEGLGLLGATLQDTERPGTLNNYLVSQQLMKDRQANQAALEKFNLGTPEQRLQALSNVASGQPNLPPGVQGPTQPMTPAERRARVSQLVSIGVPGADVIQRELVSGEINEQEARTFAQADRRLSQQDRSLGMQERGLRLQEKQFNQRLREFDKTLKDAEKPGSGLNPNQILNQQQSMRKEFSSMSGEFIKQRDAFSRIQASAEEPSAAGDLALIFNYMKLLDPGSVVREGEFATAQNSPGVSERVRAQYNRILNGQRFTPAVREDFVGRSNKLFKRAQAQQNKRTEQYTNLAVRSGLDPESIVLDLGIAGPVGGTQGATGGTQRIRFDAQGNQIQ